MPAAADPRSAVAARLARRQDAGVRHQRVVQRPRSDRSARLPVAHGQAQGRRCPQASSGTRAHSAPAPHAAVPRAARGRHRSPSVAYAPRRRCSVPAIAPGDCDALSWCFGESLEVQRTACASRGCIVPASVACRPQSIAFSGLRSARSQTRAWDVRRCEPRLPARRAIRRPTRSRRYLRVVRLDLPAGLDAANVQVIDCGASGAACDRRWSLVRRADRRAGRSGAASQLHVAAFPSAGARSPAASTRVGIVEHDRRPSAPAAPRVAALMRDARDAARLAAIGASAADAFDPERRTPAAIACRRSVELFVAVQPYVR